MSWFNKHNVEALFFFFDMNLSHLKLAAGLHISVYPPFNCPVLFDCDSSWAAIIQVTVPHVTLIGTAWPLAVDRADVLVSAANLLTPIKRNLVCILTHLQGAKVQLLFGHRGWKQVVCCFVPSCLDMWSMHRMWFFVDVAHMLTLFHCFVCVFWLYSRKSSWSNNWLNTHWKIWKKNIL